jgi:hypothetical protein
VRALTLNGIRTSPIERLAGRDVGVDLGTRQGERRPASTTGGGGFVRLRSAAPVKTTCERPANIINIATASSRPRFPST